MRSFLRVRTDTGTTKLSDFERRTASSDKMGFFYITSAVPEPSFHLTPSFQLELLRGGRGAVPNRRVSATVRTAGQFAFTFDSSSVTLSSNSPTSRWSLGTCVRRASSRPRPACPRTRSVRSRCLSRACRCSRSGSGSSVIYRGSVVKSVTLLAGTNRRPSSLRESKDY